MPTRNLTASIVTTTLLIAASLTHEHAHAQERGSAPEPQDPVVGLWATLDDLWNHGDAEGFSALFTTDADFRFVDQGQTLDGREAIHERFAQQFPQTAPDIRHRTTLHDVQGLTPDLRMADGRVHILRLRPDLPSPEIVRTFAISAVMVKSREAWRIRVLRVYELDPDAG